MRKLYQKIKKYGIKKSMKIAAERISEKIAFNICKLFPTNENLLVFESEGDLSDNSYALYEYLAENGYLNKYKVVWLVESLEHVPPYPNTYFVYKVPKVFAFRREYYLATCRHSIYDHCNMVLYAGRRKGCIVTNLWHGAIFKGIKGGVREAILPAHCTVLGKFWNFAFKIVFGYDDNMLYDTGYPRNDYFFKPMNDRQKKFAERLNLSSYRKVFLWMPTFRRSNVEHLDEGYFDSRTGLPIMKDLSSLAKFNDYLAANNCFCIFKIHHLQAELEAFNAAYSNFIVLNDSDIHESGLQLYQIVPFADCLITDYSSIATDYYLLDRPIIFTVDDYEDYRKSRSFLIDDPIKFFAGHCVKDEKEFFAALDDVISGNDNYRERRHEMQQLMHSHIDGNSCKRIVELLNL